MKKRFILTAALALGCGSAQHAVGPSEEALTADAPPRHPTETETWCPPPPDFPREIMLIVGDTCWVEIDATPAECAQYIREERHPYMAWKGRCWFFRYKKPKRQPTSSSGDPLPPVTAQ
jgi:hypothetical protein